MATNKKSSGSAQNKKTADSKKTNMKETSKVKRFFKYFFLTIVMLGLIGLVVGLGYIFAVVKTAPDLDVNSILNLNQPSMLYDDAGEFIDNLPTQEERYVISYDEMPQNLVNAYISIEDERFRNHKGIDVRRIIGAALRDVLVIIKGKRQFLVMLKDLLSHIVLNLCPHDMPVISDKIIAKALNCHKNDHNPSQKKNL